MITAEPTGEITQLLQRWNAQETYDHDRLVTLLLPELRRLAEGKMRRERVNHTLQPTALVSELYLYLTCRQKVQWKDRAHFLAVASEAMRRILVDYARIHKAKKRGGGAETIAIESVDPAESNKLLDVLEVNELLEKLSVDDPRMAQVVQLRYFGGLTIQEVAKVLNIHERTVKRDWEFARAWLFGQLRKGKSDDGGTMGASQAAV